ncbi:hypothetical protein EJB05_30826, partial [Eragrostis curvula]
MKYPILLLSVPLLLCLPSGWVLAAADIPLADRPGCQTKCGNVDIPYPFGIGDACAIHHGFYINCTKVNGTWTPLTGPFEVTKISVPDAKVWMKMGISWRCYGNATHRIKEYSLYENFINTPFWFSNEDNKIFVMGCNTLGYIGGNALGNMTTFSYVIGCSSNCSGGLEPVNGSCSGAGCCQADVPKDQVYLEAFFNEKYTPSTGCSYIVVMEEKAFNFSTTYNHGTTFWHAYKGQVPVVMDWMIKKQTCEVAINNGSYACVSNNSGCVNTTNGSDIDECHQNSPDPCAAMGGTCVGAVVLVITVTCAYLIQERRKLQHIKQRYFRQHGGRLLFEEINSRQGVAFKIFSEAELQEATDKFSEKQVLGHGGHGTVYKGLLKSNVEVAVKRCTTIDEQHKKEFGKEMLILSQINHKNIVKLLGCCLEVEVPMLVYEFIPNGTLFNLIHGNHDRHISLASRIQIAHQSAEALAYMHSWASPPVLHGDVKSSNILIDWDHTVKVSDFGASILAPTDESQFVTLVQGTCGYLDPEYMQTCQLTDKSDVYSFGVVLLELLTRKKPFNLDGPEYEKSLAMRFVSMMKQGKIGEILDDQIKDENMDILEEVAELANECLEMCGINRPSMMEVSEKLDSLRKVMQHPWAQQNADEEMDFLLGESSIMATSVSVNTGNLSIELKATKGLESGR